MAASARARFVYPDALCHPMRPFSAMSWRWRSRCVGAVSAAWLGTAVERGGTMMAASGWRSLTLASAWCRDRLVGAEELSGVGERPFRPVLPVDPERALQAQPAP